jgi:ankyrin repeat protein
MAALTAETIAIKLPSIPAPIEKFIPYFSSQFKSPASEILEPFKAYESVLRKVYAQQPKHEALKDGLSNTVPIFAGHEAELQVRARDLSSESAEEKDAYIMSLDPAERRPNGSPAIVQSLKEFQRNFSVFSESSLSDLDWRNVVVAGSAVTTALLPVPEKWAGSKRALREYYHENIAPASDVDLFLYGLTEEEGIEKIKQIETNIKDSILHETTTIRTKNAITIASQHPTRHVQIVLRLYDSISQIITGFDVDCACAAYDGNQVYASPRALTAFATQTNTIDLSRRSPSYENRLSKYSHRGFEVHWPLLDRSRIDPTIFERSFNRTLGLARLLVLEIMPKSADREAYSDQRRRERGRPEANRSGRDEHRLHGNIKEQEEDDVADWVEADEVSNYHTMVVPYGKRFNAARINKLLYTKDLLLNAEWNTPKGREVHLHRHPCFFGDVKDVVEDCCGFCPIPITEEELEAAKEEEKSYISGKLKFTIDDPGRQEIGSFNPITNEDWTEMAYVGNTQMLCQAILDGDIDYVRSWCVQDGNNIDTRDYVGRTPLHLAVMSSTLEVVQCLIDNGARMVARLVDGRTALHLASAMGNVDMVKALMQKSLANQELEDERSQMLNVAKQTTKHVEARTENDKVAENSATDSASPVSENFDDDSEDLDDSVTMGSFVKVKPNEEALNDIPEDNKDDPDVFEIDVLAWDFQTSPLHLAIVNGHIDMIRLLVDEYAADVLLPIKHKQVSYTPQSAILTLVLALSLPIEKAKEVVKVLLELGATSAQADMNEFTALHYIVSEDNSEVLDILFVEDGPAAQSVVNYVTVSSETALTIAIKKSRAAMVEKLQSLGAKPTISFDDYIKVQLARNDVAKHWSPEASKDNYLQNVTQPLMLAAQKGMPKTMEVLLAAGADPRILDGPGYAAVKHGTQWNKASSLLDVVRSKIETLKKYDGEELYSQRPQILQDEAHYVLGIKKGTYEFWSATNRFKATKTTNNQFNTNYDEQLEKTNGKDSGVPEKKKAIAQLIGDFEKVEAQLIQAGAGTFEEMYPDILKYLNNNNYNHYRPFRKCIPNFT